MMFSFSEGPAIMRGEGLTFKKLLLVCLWIANAKEIIQNAGRFFCTEVIKLQIM
jgi:hypothetical protein